MKTKSQMANKALQAFACTGLFFASMNALLADTRDFSSSWTGQYGTTTGNFSIYTPPAVDVPRVRGVIFLNPGSGGDWRFRANDTVWQEAARSLGFAVIATTQDTGYISTTETAARASLNAILTSAATATGRVELVNAPIVSTGFSLGAFVSTEWVRHVPERTLAIVAHRGGWPLTGGAHLADSRKVHSLMIPGSIDDNGLTNATYMANWFTTFRDTAITDGRAAYAMDWLTGHDSFENQGWSMAWTWIAESIAQRYPTGQLPSLTPGNPLVLNDTAVSSGWLGERVYALSSNGSDFKSFPAVAPSVSYSASTPGLASWLPNETVARVYRAFNSYDGLTGRGIPMQGPLAIVGDAAPSTTIQPGQVNPPQMAVLPLGSTIDIACDTRGYGGSEQAVLSAENRFANGDFSLWASGKPTSWTGGTAGLSQGPDLVSTGGSAVLRNNASLEQTFAPMTSDFQLRFTFTINLTPGNTAWNQPLVFNVYQANQAVNPTKPWMTFQFAAQNVSTGPFTVAAFTSDTGASVVLPGPTITGSTYDFTAGSFTGGPVKYEFVMNYFAATNSYSVSYGPAGGPLTSSGKVSYFRNPTNAAFGGVNRAMFYSYVNGFALDDVRLSAIQSLQDPISRMDYYDGATLIGSQTAPGANGWRVPYQFNTPGIRSLTIVATDRAGIQSSAFRTVVVAEPHQTGTFFHRFEQSPGFTTDHYDTIHLSRGATIGSGPVQVTLPSSGTGSAFPRKLVFQSASNESAAKFQVANNDYFNHADSTDLPSGTTPFTVEAFVNLASSGAGGLFRTIAAHGVSGTSLGWQFIVTGEGSGQGPRRLLLQFTTDGTNTTLDTMNSGFTLETGVDYYVAVVVNPADTTAAGVTFYIKNLTTGGPLQVSNRTHTRTTVFDSPLTLRVGIGWDGLLDEFRITKQALAAPSLLINQIVLPTPGGITAGVAGLQPGEIQIAWSPVASATAYRVERSTNATDFAFLASVASPGYLDAGLDPAKHYYYRVRAEDGLVSSDISDLSAQASSQPFLPSTFSGWRYLHFRTNTNTAPADVLSDPDGDGMSNLLEYATGTGDPNVSDTEPCKIAFNGMDLDFTYTRNKAAAGEVACAVKWSDELSSGIWSSSGVAIKSIVDQGDTELVTATVPRGTGNKRFIRLETTKSTDTATSAPVGTSMLSIPGGGTTSIHGLNLIAKPAFTGRASAVGVNTVDLANVDLTQRLTAGRKYALLITDGPNAGKNTSLTSWTATQMTLVSDLSGIVLPNQDILQIQELPTIGDIFGTGGEFLATGSATTSDLVTVRGSSGLLTLYCSSGGFAGVGWRAVGKGTTDYSNFPIYFTDGFSIQKKSAGSAALELGGFVQQKQVTLPVRTGTGIYSSVFASGVTLDNSGLYNASSPAKSLVGGSATMADIISFDSDGNGSHESYYYSTGGLTGVGWRKVGGGATPQGNVVIPSGFAIRKNQGSVELQRTSPY